VNNVPKHQSKEKKRQKEMKKKWNGMLVEEEESRKEGEELRKTPLRFMGF